VGIVGGTGPESTIDYYRRIIRRYSERRGDGSAPSILINSVDNQRVLALAAARKLEELTQYLCDAVDTLVAAGADFAALAANTPHLVFDEIQARAPVPLISIVEVTRSEAHAQKLTRLGLIGTRFTMQAHFYQRAFANLGMEIVTPSGLDQEYVHRKYMDELIRGIFMDETHDTLVDIILRLEKEGAIDGVILGGTELALILDERVIHGVPVLDTAGLHIEAIVTQLLS
jgi:aspartate racemase